MRIWPSFDGTLSIQGLLVRLVLAIYLPALAAAVALVVLETRATWSVTEQSLHVRTAQLSRLLRLQLEAASRELEHLADEVPAEDGGWLAFHRAAMRAASQGGLDGIGLTRPNGEHVMDTSIPWGEPVPGRIPEVFVRAARTGRPHVVQVTRGVFTGKLLVGISVPVVRDGRVRYALTGVIRVARLHSLFHDVPDGWFAAIVDRQGMVVARTPRPHEAVGRQDLSLPAAGAADLGLLHSATLDGVPVLRAFQDLPAFGWMVTVAVPRDTYYAPVWRTALVMGTGAAGVLAVGLWLAMRVRRSLVRSLATLVDEALQPPGALPEQPLAFREANRLRMRLHVNARKLAHAQAEIERMHVHFQRRLVDQIARHQADVARELHDDVGSTLAGASLLLAQVRPASEHGQSMLQHAQKQLQHAAAAVRLISRGMVPAGEQQGALPSALEQLAADAAQAASCTFRCRGDFEQLPARTAAHLYRIAQEALANARRHGGTTRVRLTLCRAGGRARLAIDDDGPGFAATDLRLHPGFGLKSMRARAAAVDGDIAFGRSPLGGARVDVTFEAM